MMDRFDKWFFSIVSFLLLVFVGLYLAKFHSWYEVLFWILATPVVMWLIWNDIKRTRRELRILQSVCGDERERDIICTLEPGHPGDHKHTHSSGGAIGWPRKGGGA